MANLKVPAVDNEPNVCATAIAQDYPLMKYRKAMRREVLSDKA